MAAGLETITIGFRGDREHSWLTCDDGGHVTSVRTPCVCYRRRTLGMGRGEGNERGRHRVMQRRPNRKITWRALRIPDLERIKYRWRRLDQGRPVGGRGSWSARFGSTAERRHGQRGSVTDASAGASFAGCPQGRGVSRASLCMRKGDGDGPVGVGPSILPMGQRRRDYQGQARRRCGRAVCLRITKGSDIAIG